MQTRQRNTTIDFLRALAIVLMIFLHVIAYYLRIPYIFFMWDVLHFVVPIFLFCSLYLFFSKYRTISFPEAVQYVKKRVVRLIVPYYLFVAGTFVLMHFGEPKNLNSLFVVNSLFLTGGIDINWIIFLFIVFTFLQPFLLYFKNRRPLVWYAFFMISVVSSVVLIFYIPPGINYRFYMWIPWSVFVFYSYYVAENQNRRYFYLINIFIGLAVFSLVRAVLLVRGGSIHLYNNEYPPNLYHLSYGWAVLNLIFFILVKKNIWSKSTERIIRFISVNSYALFFIHWLLIKVFAYYKYPWTYPWYSFFLAIIAMSLIVVFLLNAVKKLFNLRSKLPGDLNRSGS